MPPVTEKEKGTWLDPENRHCVACVNGWTNINDEPCRTCIHSGEFPMRDRPLWKLHPKFGGIPIEQKKTFTPDSKGQMKMF